MRIDPALYDRLKAAGLKVALVPGWDGRGKELGQIMGVICHHTAGSKSGNMPSLNILINGRPDLPGPLAQFGLGRDGTVYVIADGRANHAGNGNWHGVTMGNSSMIGIEAENTGLPDDSPWPQVQVDAYHLLCAEIARFYNFSNDGNADTKPSDHIAGHKEYALPHGRKSDPDFDMIPFRDAVQGIIDGTHTQPAPIPHESDTGRPTIRRGATGTLVKVAQKKLGLTADSNFGPKTEAAVRQFQRDHGLVGDGIIGPKTWLEFDKIADPL